MSEFEPVPSEMSPVKRYFTDLSYKGDSYSDMQISVEKLLEQEDLDITVEGYNLLYGSVLPTADQHEQSRIVATDMFIAMPIELLGPWVDARRDLVRLKHWYEQTAAAIHNSTMSLHRDTCYELRDDNSVECDHDAFLCPRRLLSTYLQQDIRTPDFTTVEYIVDPARARNVAITKFQVAKQLQIAKFSELRAAQWSYDRAYKEAFPQT